MSNAVSSTFDHTSGLTCPKCHNGRMGVADSRTLPDGLTIRRRRVCPACGHRLTTFETIREEKPDENYLLITRVINVLLRVRADMKRGRQFVKGEKIDGQRLRT